MPLCSGEREKGIFAFLRVERKKVYNIIKPDFCRKIRLKTAAIQGHQAINEHMLLQNCGATTIGFILQIAEADIEPIRPLGVQA